MSCILFIYLVCIFLPSMDFMNRTSCWERLYHKWSPQSLLLLWVDLSRVRLPFASRPCCATHKTVPGEHHPPVKLFQVMGKAWGCWLSSLCYWEVRTKVLFLRSCIINKSQTFACLFICDWQFLNAAHKCMRSFDIVDHGENAQRCERALYLGSRCKGSCYSHPCRDTQPMQC